MAKKALAINNWQLGSNTVFYRRSSEILQIALDWIRQHDQRPFFLFVNLMDPHEPYAPPSHWDQAFEGKIEGFMPDADEVRMGQRFFSASEWQHMRSQYDGEIAYVDSELGKFFAALDRDGFLSRSIVVITSDHGEFLGEKGLVDHQIGLYEPVIRVPLIIKVPEDLFLPTNGERTTQTIDIAPTILDLLGLDIPAFIQGRSLVRGGGGPAIAQHYVDEHVQDWYGGRFNAEQIAVIADAVKFIKGTDDSEELYDLRSDRDEERNLVPLDTERLRRFREILNEWRTSTDERVHPEGATPAMDDETLRQLEALGYVR
jgi:arylsulfatase A-like enzyme